jgi:hypothetical protein
MSIKHILLSEFFSHILLSWCSDFVTTAHFSRTASQNGSNSSDSRTDISSLRPRVRVNLPLNSLLKSDTLFKGDCLDEMKVLKYDKTTQDFTNNSAHSHTDKNITDYNPLTAWTPVTAAMRHSGHFPSSTTRHPSDSWRKTAHNQLQPVHKTNHVISKPWETTRETDARSVGVCVETLLATTVVDQETPLHGVSSD